MYEKLEVCPICKGTHFINHLICTDHTITSESFALTKCKKCELVFTNPRPDETSIAKYYDSKTYISHHSKSVNLLTIAYKAVRSYSASKKIAYIRKYNQGQKLLDYGCGTGEFLHSARKKGFQVTGYEPNNHARQQVASKNIRLLSDLSETKEKFDVITAWHVIEHVHELRKTVKLLRRHLAKSGTMFIAVPNIHSYDAAHYGAHWAAYDVPRHLYHFSRATLKKLLTKTKLKCIDILPLPFDSYYVSLLSEKNATGKFNYLKAIKVGRKSNALASQNGEFSSLMYVIEK